MPTPILTESAPISPKLTLGRILVVEDEDLIRDTIALTLSDEGYEVTTAVDGQQALARLQAAMNADRSSETALPDLIILDLMLPYINGLDICRWMRREGSSVPILILSAKGSEMDRVVGLEVGADDYLTKPFGMRELVARCRALLRRHQQFQPAQTEPTLQYQEVTIYPQECRVTVRGEVVNFSPKEFKLLELFLRHPKRVWSRDQLLEKIWGHDFIGESKTVDVHIRWIREKLEIDPSNPQYLITVRGFGYRFG
ncbi:MULTISPECIES: response regulator transcription factor [Leptolyngbya]|jgi:two-component system phosphate regulon response regulator PhoB|uniref:Response regulator receiver domain protein n=3 Tax=Leptolyngbya TaxID=47251 RepID=A0A1Z4JBP2_LEPBY|nr:MULTISPECIES: response regulator transcription factor [Leptolyngbya]MCY6490418.1 response regulator transcription factor [Leptolyngbya sp. GGD]WNZ49232.1 response regulator transcription factor [Leptolyngbya boryana CZ1]BAY54204.1 response regulator receiver domain protein [Leptolyngbya boryana NIES-2135]MBD1856512.1 response regulator transcription factor [Leptolyngbya sp. FACHB-1624]MBD2370267.1 response regulator transcription factor [Leptolyngbya sp. FACHB-161]